MHFAASSCYIIFVTLIIPVNVLSASGRGRPGGMIQRLLVSVCSPACPCPPASCPRPPSRRAASFCSLLLPAPRRPLRRGGVHCAAAAVAAHHLASPSGTPKIAATAPHLSARATCVSPPSCAPLLAAPPSDAGAVLKGAQPLTGTDTWTH